jgi:hypothetical protein
MAEAEAVTVFKAVPEGAVQTDMRGPDQTKREDLGRLPKHTPGDASERKAVPVTDIVDCCSCLAPNQIAEHGQIGSQEQDSEHPPTGAQSGVGRRNGNQDEEGFEAQKDFRRPRMPDDEKLTPADSSDIADSIAFALQFSGRKRVHDSDQYMAASVANRIVRHLERAGFVVMKKPPAPGAGDNPDAQGLPDSRASPTVAAWSQSPSPPKLAAIEATLPDGPEAELSQDVRDLIHRKVEDRDVNYEILRHSADGDLTERYILTDHRP